MQLEKCEFTCMYCHVETIPGKICCWWNYSAPW